VCADEESPLPSGAGPTPAWPWSPPLSTGLPRGVGRGIPHVAARGPLWRSAHPSEPRAPCGRGRTASEPRPPCGTQEGPPSPPELMVLLLHTDSFCWNSFLRHDNPVGITPRYTTTLLYCEYCANEYCTVHTASAGTCSCADNPAEYPQVYH